MHQIQFFAGGSSPDPDKRSPRPPTLLVIKEAYFYM